MVSHQSEFENWYQQCFNESVNQCDLEVGIPKKTDPSNSNTITNNNNNNCNSMKKALIDINFNEKEKLCISTQNSEKDYLDEFQQIQENNLSDRKGLLSYEHAKEMFAYKTKSPPQTEGDYNDEEEEDKAKLEQTSSKIQQEGSEWGGMEKISSAT
uniref:PBC domain-containing protein n=1 Tax=Trichobilharzia regenti TaxID=157069 RepID=A0AA85JCK8_TRIRE|nr:unnamed protein product [Trichobilharzia regenti]CAH8820411.1 unnamed protein product [Trichobilharzia regenti]